MKQCFIFGLLLGSVMHMTVANASWFRNAEQDAAQKYHEGEYVDAAKDFTDTYRRGVALYRAGRYTDAGEAFEKVEREDIKPDALYNLGNSRYKRSDYEGAVDAYQAALTLRPKDEDTLHNMGLAKKMLEQTTTEELQEEEQEEEEQEEEEQEEQEEEQEEQEEESESEQEESEESSGEEEQESEESSGEQ